MKIATLAAALVLAACAHRPPAMDVPASLAAAESAFAAHSVREDMRAAFLAAFADDGVIVRNGWTVSNLFLANRPAPGGPWKVEVDLGISHPTDALWSEPLQLRTKPAEVLGWYLRVWRREAGGWRVFLDVINPAPPRG